MHQLFLGMLLTAPASAGQPPFIQVQRSLPPNILRERSITVSCPVGRVAIAGGVEVAGFSHGLGMTESGPGNTPEQWVGGAQNIIPPPLAWGLTVSALCASPAVMQHIQRVTVTASQAPGSTFVEAYATCPAGSQILSGGTTVNGVMDGVLLRGNGSEGNTAWYGRATAPVNAGIGLQVDAFCIPEPMRLAHFYGSISASIESYGEASGWAACLPGAYAVGGGTRVYGAVDTVAIGVSSPDPLGGAPYSWLGEAIDLGGSPPGWALRTETLCLRLP
jgi:hypothetical protein